MIKRMTNFKVFSATTLKFIAITAMIIDHLAWGFVDLNTLEGQIIHLIGRLTVPLMCYFMVEGYIYTSDIRKYIKRLLICGVISIIPFNIYFWDMYGYRQNIMFDFIMGLFVLIALDSKKLKVVFKVLITTGILILSLFVGGWPVVPILYMVIFYYCRENFKLQFIWFTAVTVGYEVIAISYFFICQNIGRYNPYQDFWWERLYLLGFMIPFMIIRLYSGKRGGEYLGKYAKWVFYAIYPAHLIALIAIRYAVNDYLGVQFLQSIWGMI